MSPNVSKAISIARFPLMIGILFIHNRSIVTDDNLSGAGYDIYRLIYTFGSELFSSICVPAFFFISGYLFFSNVENFNTNIYVFKLRKRLTSLVIPYIIWNAIPAIIVIVKGLLGEDGGREFSVRWFLSFYWDYTSGGDVVNIFGWHVPVSFPINGSLWFVRDLTIMSVLSPIVYFVMRYLKFVGVLTFVILYVFTIWPHTIFLMGATSLCFFSLGAYFSIHQKDFERFERLSRRSFLFWLLAVVLLYCLHLESVLNLILVRACNVLGVFAFIGIVVYWVTHYRVLLPRICTESVFFVYAAHTIYINAVVGVYLLPAIIPGQHYLLLLLKYLLATLVTWAICVCIYMFLKRTIPNVLMIMNGGR